MDLTHEWIAHEVMTPRLQSLQAVFCEEQDVVLANLRMPRAACERMGAPRELTLEYVFKNIRIQWNASCSGLTKMPIAFPKPLG